jgi:putative hydroxymethylpyrimidine transport system ATP-binding protein
MNLVAPSITIKEAYLSYNGTVLFDHLNLSISAGKCTCILGPSGVGKTTLLKIIADLIHNDKNTIFTCDITSSQNLTISDNMTFMAQTDLLLPWLNALDNALIGLRLRGDQSTDSISQAHGLFDRVGLRDSKNKYPHELSGGMRQRVALIRTLLQNKPIILMDEPFSSLDAITRYELQNLAAELLKDKTVLLITHDPMEALRIADEIYVMSGQPASMNSTIHLSTPIPRNLADPDVLKYQEVLYDALVKAKISHEISK